MTKVLKAITNIIWLCLPYVFLKSWNKLKNSRKFKLYLNLRGKKYQCNICKRTFNSFNDTILQPSELTTWSGKYFTIGIGHTLCDYCSSTSRLRTIYAYFDKLNLWPKSKDKVLHFAPEAPLYKRIISSEVSEYIKADLYDDWGINDIKKINIMDIPYPENYFDIVICNHVLEHIPDLKKGIAEIHRVIKKGGFAILMAPMSMVLENHFQDAGINTDDTRTAYYGQNDHVILLSKKQYLQDLQNQGFQLDLKYAKDTFESGEYEYFGLEPKEFLVKVIK